MIIKTVGRESFNTSKSPEGLLNYLHQFDLINSKGEMQEEVKIYLGGLFCQHPDEDESLFNWTFSTFDMDREYERIDPKGWDLEHYKKNPVVLWGHNASIPAIGYTKSISCGKDLKGQIIFNDKSFDEFGWGIGQRVKAGVLRAGSVGFLAEKIEIGEEKGEETLIFRNQELLEFSICNVPSNPFALSFSERNLESGKALENWGGMGGKGFWRGLLKT